MDTTKRVALTIVAKHVFDCICMNVSLYVYARVRACAREGLSACVRASVGMYIHNYVYACILCI